MSNFFTALVLLGTLAFVIGLVGLIVAAIRRRTKTRWVITIIVSFVVVIIGGIGLSATDSGGSDEVAEEQQATETGAPAENEAAEGDDAVPAGEEVSEEAEAPVPTWTVDDTGFLIDVSVVSGDEKSVTLEFLYESTSTSVYAQDEFQKVTIGDASYRVDNDPYDVFVGLPIITKLNDTQFDFFIPTIGASPDDPVIATYTMNDGSDLPDSIVLNYDASETRYSPWTGGNTVDHYRNWNLTIERS